jgi:hypothetical protein
MERMKRPRRRAKAGLRRAKPLGREPNPKHWDIMRDMHETILELRKGMSLEDKKRTSWYRPNSSSE